MIFNHLSDGEFEEFTHDLLRELGFVNLSWRRGSGKGGASADQGRDIEALYRRLDVDKAEHLEQWFIQCKRYEQGVPPERLQSAIAWANAERPAVLLFVASNFLSNPAKAWIEDYKENNRPAYRIKVWERKDLEQFVASRPALATRYKLQLSDPVLHPAHLQYMLSPGFNSLDYFFETLDSLDAGIRDELLNFSFFSVINPRLKESETGTEMLKDLMLDAVDYNSFRARCHELASQGVGDEFLVHAIVCETLAWARDFGDPAKVEVVIERHRRGISYCSKQLLTEKHPQRRAGLEDMIVRSRERIEAAPTQQKTWANYYKNFCEAVLPRLRLEDSRGRFVS